MFIPVKKNGCIAKISRLLNTINTQSALMMTRLGAELKPSSETLSNPVVTYPCIVITLALLGLPSQGCIGLNISLYIAPPHPQ